MREDISLTNVPFRSESHLAWVVGTDGDAKRRLYEGVVDQVGHVVERLPIVFTDTVREVAVRGPDHKEHDIICLPCGTKHSSPPVKIRLAEIHHEQRHRKRCQDQQHLGGDGAIFLRLILGPTRYFLRPCEQTHPWSFSNPSQRERTQSPHFENKLEREQEKHVCLFVLNRQQMQHFQKRDRLELQGEIG